MSWQLIGNIAGKDGRDGIGTKGERGERGESGQDVDMNLVHRELERLVMSAVHAIPIPKDGVPGERGERGQDGKDADMVALERQLKQLVMTEVATIPTPKDGLPGKDADMAAVKRELGELVTKAVSAIPVPKDGRDGSDGKDGIGVMDAMLDREGQLIVTLSNGQTKAVGIVVGKDGQHGVDGTPGRDVDPLFVQDFLTKELAKWPKPKDGQDGKDGHDGAPGLSPDDFEFDFDPETRAFTIKFIRNGVVIAERTKTLTGMRIYRGVYQQGRAYEHGDVTSWDGSEWTALAATKDRPGNGETAWKMTVKHGEKGARGPDGKPGRDGRDLTQLGDGRKW